jgi:hypothetical protein
MGRVYEELDDRLAEWIGRQSMFFVATAPSSGGHVNVSPKGIERTFAIIDPHTVAYLDLEGSGAETIAHLRDNGRITFMFCSFEGPARIVRLYGRGEIHLAGEPGFRAIRERFGDYRARSIIVVSLERIADSCGFGVPEMSRVGQRSRLTDLIAARTEDDVAHFLASFNRVSIDGLPAIDAEPSSAPTSG